MYYSESIENMCLVVRAYGTGDYIAVVTIIIMKINTMIIINRP